LAIVGKFSENYRCISDSLLFMVGLFLFLQASNTNRSISRFEIHGRENAFQPIQNQTLREPPSNARAEGFAWLVRTGYLTREGVVTALGQRVISRSAQAYPEM